MSLLIEGGGQILATAFSGGWVDEVVFYTAPLISGSGRPVLEAAAFEGGSIAMEFIDCQRVDKDIRMHALVKKEART
jgi:riboflavin biosynthesis pyrimidine reductase